MSNNKVAPVSQTLYNFSSPVRPSNFFTISVKVMKFRLLQFSQNANVAFLCLLYNLNKEQVVDYTTFARQQKQMGLFTEYLANKI